MFDSLSPGFKIDTFDTVSYKSTTPISKHEKKSIVPHFLEMLFKISPAFGVVFYFNSHLHPPVVMESLDFTFGLFKKRTSSSLA